MAELGDKWYNKAYYGERQREWYNSGDPRPHAMLVDKNTWGYYSYNGEFIPGRKGQPLDETIALWLLDKNCSWATNTTLYIKAQNTLLRNDYSVINESNIPFVMQATAHDSNLSDERIEFTRNPVYRLAYDNSDSRTTVYSALYADIDYSAYCMQAGILAYDWSLSTNKLQGRTLDNLKSFIDTDPDKRDVVGLRGYLYRGTGDERVGYTSGDYRGAEYMPPYYPGEAAYRSIPLGDIFNDYIIPDDAEYLQSLIQDGHSEWVKDKVYAPFFYQFGRWWYEPTGPNNNLLEINNQFTVGTFRDLPVSSVINGHCAIDSPTHKITGAFYKCSPALQSFNDVSYRWKTKVVDQTTGDVYDNGYDLTQLPSNRYLRVLSYIYIEDMKDAQTKGEALRRAVLHEWAYLGFYFTATEADAKTVKTGSDAPAAALAKLYLPVFRGGTTTGEYVTGEAIREAPNADSSSVGGDEFAPSGELKDMTPDLSNVALGGFYQTGHIYCNIENFTWLLRNIDGLEHLVEYEGTKMTPQDYYFFGADPYDFIIGYYAFPAIFLPDDILYEYSYLYIDKSYIQMGKFSTEIWADNPRVFPAKGREFGFYVPARRVLIPATYIPRTFNNFLDYEPYTTMSLYLPYYGTVQLPPSLFVGHRIMVLTLSDLMSGRVTFLIYLDEKQYTTVSANCRVEYPLTGTDISEYTRTIMEGRQEIINNRYAAAQSITNLATRTAISASVSFKHDNLAGGRLNLIGAAASGALTVASTHSQNKFIRTELERTQPSPQVISLGSGTDGLGNIIQPFIAFNFPIKLDYFDSDMASNYGKVNGFACYDVNTLSAYHGFTIMENPILDGLDCSAEEKEMIRNLLSEGVILP